MVLQLRGQTQFAVNSTFHTKMKHVAFVRTIVRERIKENKNWITDISNTMQRADVLTKALRSKAFLELRNKLSNDYQRMKRCISNNYIILEIMIII